MSALAARLAGVRGWRRALLLFVFGAIGAAAMPPVSFTPALLIAFVAFAWMLDGSARAWRAALDGWCFGFGFFVAGLYWVAYALLTDIAQFAWLLPFAVLGLPALLAIFTAAAGMFAYWMWLPNAGRVLSLAVAWSTVEWMRGHLFTGFPWNLVGYTWSWSDAMMQPASMIGIYGVSFLTVLVAAALAALAPPPGARPGAGRWLMPMLALVILAGGVVYGTLRLSGADNETVAEAGVRIVQANVAQQFKWDPDQIRANVERHLALTRRPGIESARIVVWPETAMPYTLDSNPDLRAALGGLVRPGALFASGVQRLEVDATGQMITAAWNNVSFLDSAGAIVATYDKAHLVPFGEYLPLRPLLAMTGLEKVVPGLLDYSAGPGPRTLMLPSLPPVSPLVCYEAIFPGAVTAADRPGWLLNVTNDAWYGTSAGPYQHFAIARWRAVEEGLPLVRAANTGISGVIDAYGRVRARLDLATEGVLDALLPVALPPTLYVAWRDWPLLIVLMFLGVTILVAAGMARANRSAIDRTDLN